MEEEEPTYSTKPKGWPILLFLLLISITSSVFAIYELTLLSTIENVLRYSVIGVLILIDFVLFKRFKSIMKPKKKKKKKSKHVLYTMFMLLFILFNAVVGGGIYFIYGEVSSINKVYVTYTSDLIVPFSSNVNKVSEMKDYKIGILSDETSVEGYIIPHEMIRENKITDENELVEYDDYTSMIVDLYSGDINGCFITDTYVDSFSGITGYENIAGDTKIILSKSKEMKKSDASKKETSSSGKNVTEPFTILLMGIDSTDEVLSKNAVANGDTLILITFNPKTLNATMLSIPRDSYVPIACWNNKAENKITHAAAYGNDCMISTIEDYFDVNIDYYAKINFKGLVKLVDALGGVEIDVEKRLCTDDSNRYEEVCIEPGKQTLGGEQALVYARNRKQLANGDFGRNYHQQVLVMALMDKVKTIDDVGTFVNLLNTVSNSMDTNFTTKQMLSFYNVAKDIIKKGLSSDEADLVNIERLYLQGSSQMIYDERARMVLYEYVPNVNSKKDIIKAMKVNLGKAQHEDIKEFSFSINEVYEKPVIGYGPYKNSGLYELVPDFTGDSYQTAKAYCDSHSIKCTFVGTGGYVVKQDLPANARVDNYKDGVTITLSQNNKVTNEKDTTTNKKPTNKVVDDDEEDEDDDDIKTPVTPPTPSDDDKEDNDVQQRVESNDSEN